MVVIADLLVFSRGPPPSGSHDKLMSQLPSPKVTGLSSSPVLERAPGRDGVGGQCNLAGGTKWGRNLAELGQGPCPQHAWGGRAQRWAVSAAGTWRGARPGPCPHHAWAVERSDGLCRVASMWRGARPGAVSASCLVGRVQRGLCAASMRRGARPGGAVSASCLGVAYSEGCVRPAWRSRERPVSAKVLCVSLWVASWRTALSHVGSRQGGYRSGVTPPFTAVV